MSAPPRVSIVLPTYNGSRYLAKALDSILAQSYEALECLVVVDGSTDSTGEVLARYTDPRLRTIVHAQNKGLPASLNTGLRAARGDYLTWTSDDNEYEPQALERLVEALSNRKDVGLVYSAFRVVFEGDPEPPRLTLPGCPELCAVGYNRVGCCFLFTRELFERTGEYDETLQGVEDYDYWIRARKHFRFATLREPLYLYRFHGAALTARYPEKIRVLTRELKTRHFPLDDLPAFCAERARASSPEGLEIGPAPCGLDAETRRALLSHAVRENMAAVVLSPSLPAADDDTTPDHGLGLHPLDAVCRQDAFGPRLKIESLLCLSQVADYLDLTPDCDPAEALNRIGAQGGDVAVLVGKAQSNQPLAEKVPAFYRAGYRLAGGFHFRNLPRHLVHCLKSPAEAALRWPFFIGVYARKIRSFDYTRRSGRR